MFVYRIGLKSHSSLWYHLASPQLWEQLLCLLTAYLKLTLYSSSFCLILLRSCSQKQKSCQDARMSSAMIRQSFMVLLSVVESSCYSELFCGYFWTRYSSQSCPFFRFVPRYMVSISSIISDPVAVFLLGSTLEANSCNFSVSMRQEQYFCSQLFLNKGLSKLGAVQRTMSHQC